MEAATAGLRGLSAVPTGLCEQHVPQATRTLLSFHSTADASLPPLPQGLAEGQLPWQCL